MPLFFIRKTKIVHLFFAVSIFMVINCGNIFANNFHYSIIAGTYTEDTTKIIYDFSLFLNQQWGARYTVIPDFEYQNDKTISSSTDSVSNYSIKGDFKAPSIVYLLGYQTISNTEAGPFDFVTAYISAGYAEQKVTVKENRYTASGSKMVKSYHEYSSKAPVYLTSFGFYGGEKFVVFDTSIRYLQGKMNDKEAIPETVEFTHWLISASIGLGF